MPASRATGSTWRALVDAPGMFLLHKYNQFKRQRQTDSRRKVTEIELQRLNGKIDKLLAKLDERQCDTSPTLDDECVVCMSARATMQTLPCGHKVLCRTCFVKTIQVAVSQRCIPLKCVICRSRIIKLKQPGHLPVTKTTTKLSRSVGGQAHVCKKVDRTVPSDRQALLKCVDQPALKSTYTTPSKTTYTPPLRNTYTPPVKSTYTPAPRHDLLTRAKLLPSGGKERSHDVGSPWFARCRHNSPHIHPSPRPASAMLHLSAL